MKITELLTKETVLLSVNGKEKYDVINELVDVLDRAGKLINREQFKTAVIEREVQSTTGIGDGVAIPHAKDSSVKHAAIAFGKSVHGVDYEALDGQPCYLFFMIAAPEGANNTHLQALSHLATILMNPNARQQLIEASTVDEVLAIINSNDDEEDEIEVTVVDKKNFIVAVTACPTGIAQTYMAADSLKAKAAELGVDIKVETNGSRGVKNVLTQEEIENAIAVIVAADTKVKMDRFKGKHVLETAVADGIRKPEELINRALKQDIPVYMGEEEHEEDFLPKEAKRNGIGAVFYKHIMNGVSNMLPFVVGGGILMAISLLFGNHSANLDDPSYNTFAAVLHEIGFENTFSLIVPVLAGFIAMSIADRPGFAPGMVAGMMAAVSGAGFLGGLTGGFLAGYIVIGLKRALRILPASLEGIKTIMIYPLLGITCTGFVMKYIVNTPVAAVNTAIIDWLTELGTTNAIFLGIVLGMMMAFDMGGPINKSAYLFGTGLLASGVYEPMAAIMAAGMVPPLAIALATTIFKNRFTKQDLAAGKANYIMGLSFITEGAIPFAAADPFRVIPSAMVGSAIAGAFSMAAGIGLLTPHGGVFVIPLVAGNWAVYVGGIVFGTLVSALMLGFLKKPLKK